MKLLLQIVVLAVVWYQASAAKPEDPSTVLTWTTVHAHVPRECGGFNKRCLEVGGTCSIFPPGRDWVSQFICNSGSRCRCWVRRIPAECNGRCRSGDQCSKTSPGIGWKSTGQICGTNGCKCWRTTSQCHDDKCKAMGGVCSERSPGKGWWR